MIKNIPFLKHLAQSRNEQLRYLPQSVKMEEAVNPHIINLTMTLITIAIVCFVTWASFTEVNEVATAEGEVVPQGFVQVVQHLDGGLVTEILVNEGDLVKKNQVLLRIDDGGARQDLAETHALQNSLLLQRERLLAFLENRNFDVSALEATASDRAQQKRIFDSTQQSKETEKQVIRDQIAQKKEYINTLNERSKTLKKNIKISKEILSMKEKMVTKGSISKKELLDNQRSHNDVQGQLAQTKSDIAAAKNALEEFQNRLFSQDAKYKDDAYAQLDKLEADIKQNKEVILKLENRVARLDIRTPATGLVKGLKLNTIGGVVEPGQTLMEILPVDKSLVVEAKISTSDIGHIEIGQNVKVKIRSYDFSRYGAVEGSLDFVTATTFLDDQNNPYYRGRVVLEKDYVGSNAVNKILPGMTVQADIVTGRKTILSYLLKPIGRAMQTAMTER